MFADVEDFAALHKGWLMMRPPLFLMLRVWLTGAIWLSSRLSLSLVRFVNAPRGVGSDSCTLMVVLKPSLTTFVRFAAGYELITDLELLGRLLLQAHERQASCTRFPGAWTVPSLTSARYGTAGTGSWLGVGSFVLRQTTIAQLFSEVVTVGDWHLHCIHYRTGWRKTSLRTRWKGDLPPMARDNSNVSVDKDLDTHRRTVVLLSW